MTEEFAPGLTLLVGGARSGKSALAVQLAASAGFPVVFIATGEPGDDEMRVRIEHHRARRPREWKTIEEPVEPGTALSRAAAGTCVVLDCLTLWISNLMDRGLADDAIRERAAGAASLARARVGPTIAVTNEVGSGIVPANALARRYRDLLGEVNAIWAEASDTVLLVVAGRTLSLASPAALGISADD